MLSYTPTRPAPTVLRLDRADHDRPCSGRVPGGKMARRYSKSAGGKVKRSMHEMKRGKLRSGRSGAKVKSRKQAIAIGLSEARREGKKVPPKKKKSSSRGKRSRRKS